MLIRVDCALPVVSNSRGVPFVVISLPMRTSWLLVVGLLASPSAALVLPSRARAGAVKAMCAPASSLLRPFRDARRAMPSWRALRSRRFPSTRAEETRAEEHTLDARALEARRG